MYRWHDQISNSIKTRLISEDLTEKESVYVINKLRNACRMKDSIDNFRMSVNGKNLDMYNAIRVNGCCGFYDEIVYLHSGKTVKFGFNYGH